MNNYMIKIKLELENTSPFHSGKDTEIIADKREVIENNKKIIEEKIRIFGSSILGAIKSQLEQNEINEALFGSFESTNDDSKENKVFISDFKSTDYVRRIDRTGIKKDNETGTTKHGGLYENKIIPRETKFELFIEAMKLSKNEKEEFTKIFDEIIEKIQKGLILFGGNKTNGFGQFEIKRYWKQEFNLETKEGLINYLDWNDFEGVEAVIPNPNNAENKADIKFVGKLADSLIVKSNESNGNIVNALTENGRYIIPAGSIKGSMRTYAERILNSIETKLDKDKLLTDLFGHDSDEKKHENFKMGKINVSDYRFRENVKITPYNRIKIDRFTGGNMDGALMVENRIVGEEIKLEMKINRDLDPQEKALILLYLRDLGQGKIPLGSSSGTGSGRLVGKEAKIGEIVLRFAEKDNKIIVTSDQKNTINEIINSL